MDTYHGEQTIHQFRFVPHYTHRQRHRAFLRRKSLALLCKHVFPAGRMSRLLDLRRRLAFSRRRSLRWASTTKGLAIPYVGLYLCINPNVKGRLALSAIHACLRLPLRLFLGLARALHAAYYRRDLGAGGAVRIDAAPTRSASLFSACISAATSGIPSFNRFSLLRSSISPGK
jgi:hypothetical protein